MRFSVVEDHGVRFHLKRWILPEGRSPRRIRTGILRGLAMELDFQHQTQRWLGLQERELSGWFRKLSRHIHTAIDVGANDGMYTLYFLARTPARKVLAFEPSPEDRERLRRNLRLNGLSADERLQVVPKFVGASTTQEMIALDCLAEAITSPCLIKVDIDGGEIDLLRGAQGLLSRTGMRWIIEVHSERLREDCREILRTSGYRTVSVANAWWRVFLPELRPGERNDWLIATRD